MIGSVANSRFISPSTQKMAQVAMQTAVGWEASSTKMTVIGKRRSDCSVRIRNCEITRKWYSTTRQCGFIGGDFRLLSSPSSSDSIDIGRWPIRKKNTILNIVPQGQKHVVERLGRLHSIEESGYFFAIPFFDEISYIIDVRERAIDIQPQVSFYSVEFSRGKMFGRSAIQRDFSKITLP